VTTVLSSRVQTLLPPGLSFADVWVEGGEASELSPLFPEEEPIVARAVEKRRREFRAGRHVARRALEDAGGLPCALPRGVHGAPGFPPGYHGSITHTGREHTYAAAVVTPAPRLVGIDAEMQDELAPELARRIATPLELELAARATDRPGLLVFAAKEAVYKCIYPRARRILGFDEVCLRQASPSELELTVLAVDGAPRVQVRWLREQGVTFCLAIFP